MPELESPFALRSGTQCIHRLVSSPIITCIGTATSDIIMNDIL